MNAKHSSPALTDPSSFSFLSFRTAELKSLKGRKYLDALCVYFWATTPVLISILTFATYVALGNRLTAAKVIGSSLMHRLLFVLWAACPSQG